MIDCLKTIYELNNEKDYYNEFLQIIDLEKLFWKIVGVILVFEVLDNNLYLYLIDCNEFFN